MRYFVILSSILGLAAPVWGEAQSILPLAARLDATLAEEIFVPARQSPAPRCGDPTFVRRIYLDLVGELPTPEEITAFVLDTGPDKRRQLADQLLEDPRFGRNWANYWRDCIMARRTEERALLAAPALQRYLAREFHANTPWDQIAGAFITAEGNIREQGETALIAAQMGQPEETAAEVSRVFLGMQIQCAQCHDHPTDRWKREQFHQLAAFFPRVAIQPRPTEGGRTFVLVAHDDPPRRQRQNPDQRRRGTLEHRMPDLQDPSAPGRVMAPVFFLTGQELELGASDAQRRQELSAWVTSPNNPWFARAFVNRLWAELVGTGFYQQVDDLGPDREVRAPMTLELLADSFASNGYNIKDLMRTIVATEAYQRVSRSRAAEETLPFLTNVPQRLRGDQLFDVLMGVLGVASDEDTAEADEMPARRRSPRMVINATFGYDPSSPRDEVAGSLAQALTMMNSPILDAALSADNPHALGKWLNTIPADQSLIEEMYLRSLARLPDDRELQTCIRHIRAINDRNVAMEDILWALINSTEFQCRE